MKGLRIVLCACLLLALLGCHGSSPPADTLVVVIESSPNNLDPRIGTDAQSERIGGLIFDALVTKDARFDFKPWIALSWERAGGSAGVQDWVFHLRDGVRFHDGRPLEAEDVAWTIDSLLDGSLVTAKAGNFASVRRAYARDPLTLVVEMKREDQSLLFNLSDGLFGVVPRGSGREFARHPVGSGSFRFVSEAPDREVVLERAPGAWSSSAYSPDSVKRVRFSVVPDAVTTALELKKGSADVAVNVVTLDMVHVLERTPGLADETGPGTPVYYLNFNCAHGPLADKRVRQAVALALDRQAIVDALWLGRARVAQSLLPPEHWAAAPAGSLTPYAHAPARAAVLLEQAGYHAGADGVRLHLEMKTSQDETTRLMALVMQQQLRAAGIALTLRATEFGTFYADVSRGAFEMYALKWMGSNEDPDIFRYAFASSQMPPVGGNRGRYSNPRVDTLLVAAAATPDQAARRQDYLQVQQILADDLPAIPLWFPQNNVLHTTRVSGVSAAGDGDYSFLRDARLTR